MTGKRALYRRKSCTKTPCSVLCLVGIYKSTQIALQNNYYGMDYQNTKSLCQDLIRNELEKYKADAEQLAKERDEKFLSTLFEKLHRENIDDNSMCKEFRNPDMQYTFVEA